jgi:hypothetical protein
MMPTTIATVAILAAAMTVSGAFAQQHTQAQAQRARTSSAT